MDRLANLLVVLLAGLLAAALPAHAQDPAPSAPPSGSTGADEGTFSYGLTGGAAGALTLRRDGAALLLSGRLDGQDVSLRGERQGDAWRFVLPGTPGLAGALSGARGAPRVLLLRRGAGDLLEGRIEGQGQAPVTFSGARERQPAAECAPTRDRWWSRHGVAAWEVGRALWDFYKPGSRRLEELRGGVTGAQTRALRARLEQRRAAPWTPEVIYAEARAMSPTPRAALELAFGLTVDNMDLPLAPLPGVDPREPIFDKYEHFFASAILAHRGNAAGSFTVGWLKEVMDEVSGGTYSDDDLIADSLGAEFGQRLQCGD